MQCIGDILYAPWLNLIIIIYAWLPWDLISWYWELSMVFSLSPCGFKINDLWWRCVLWISRLLCQMPSDLLYLELSCTHQHLTPLIDTRPCVHSCQGHWVHVQYFSYSDTCYSYPLKRMICCHIWVLLFICCLNPASYDFPGVSPFFFCISFLCIMATWRFSVYIVMSTVQFCNQS